MGSAHPFFVMLSEAKHIVFSGNYFTALQRRNDIVALLMLKEEFEGAG
jgi:hypothetical protein